LSIFESTNFQLTPVLQSTATSLSTINAAFAGQSTDRKGTLKRLILEVYLDATTLPKVQKLWVSGAEEVRAKDHSGRASKTVAESERVWNGGK
jgi:hypothetical protein